MMMWYLRKMICQKQLQEHSEQNSVCLDMLMMMFFSNLFRATSAQQPPKMCSTRRFDEETGLIGSKMVEKKLFLDRRVPEAAVGQITGLLSMEHGDQFSSHQNRSCIGFGPCATASTPTARDFIDLHENLVVSEVDCSKNDMAMVKTTPPDFSCYVVDCGNR
jgi:hypothetical protein